MRERLAGGDPYFLAAKLPAGVAAVADAAASPRSLQAFAQPSRSAVSMFTVPSAL